MVYADYWIALQEGHLTYGTFEDYKSIINRHIKPSMKGLRMRDVLPDDITRMMKEVANFSKSVHDKTYMLAKQMTISLSLKIHAPKCTQEVVIQWNVKLLRMNR